MKTIRIPTNCNPYIVVINNNVYVYKAGDNVEVPDEVAELIKHHVDSIPKPLANGSGSLDKFKSLVYKSITEVTENDLDGLMSIGDYAFYNCTKLTSVTIPDSIARIGNQAFAYCTSLESIVIPDSVTYFGERLFSYSTALKKVTLRAMTPPTIKTDTLYNVPTTCAIEVPSESVEAYKSALYWSAIASQIKAIEE